MRPVGERQEDSHIRHLWSSARKSVTLGVKEFNPKVSGGIKIVSENRKARFNYEILETFEAGMVLTGAEIKSLRKGQISLGESYVRPEGDEIVLVNAHIQPYEFEAHKHLYDPLRKRKLLLHRREIDQLRAAVERKGLTLVPLKVYLKGGYAKVEVALVRGKAAPDKRQTIKEREGKREAERALKRRHA